MNEGPRYHLQWGHRGFDARFMDQWIADGCYGQVNNLMGYRLQYDLITHADTMTHGTTVPVYLTMRNYGWGRVLRARQAQVRFVNNADPTNVSKQIVCKFGQLRTLPAQATASTALRALCPIPALATTPAGVYTGYLEIPDMRVPGMAVPAVAYNIRPANVGTWDSTLRRFSTGTTMTVN